MPRDAPPPHREAQAGARLATEVLAGFSVVLRQRRLRLVVGALAVATLVEGVADVLIVVFALDVLDIGEAGLGTHERGLGRRWAARRRGRGGARTGSAGWRPRSAAAAWSSASRSPASRAGRRSSRCSRCSSSSASAMRSIEVAGVTLTQRLAGDDVIGRVFGVLESTYVITTAIGSALAPVAIALLGVEGALLATGATMAAVALLAGRPLARSEASVPVPEREFALLRGLGIFAPLPLATVETLATRLQPGSRSLPATSWCTRASRATAATSWAQGEIELSTRKGWRTALGAGGSSARSRCCATPRAPPRPAPPARACCSRSSATTSWQRSRAMRARKTRPRRS